MSDIIKEGYARVMNGKLGVLWQKRWLKLRNNVLTVHRNEVCFNHIIIVN